MDLLDVSKENIQPLKRGRNISALSVAIQAQTDEEIHQKLMKKREEFEVSLRSYSGDDPLKPWYDYVQWVEQNFPKHGREGNLKVLLENCLSQFKDSEEYAQDVRYIDLWTRYVSFVDDPLELYKQIHAQGIGSECAIFYQCWAEEYEQANDMKRADQVFIEGIRSNAQPIDELITAHTNFQIRVARNVLGQNPVSNSEATIERTALSTLRAHGRRRNMLDSTRVGNSIKNVTPGVLKPAFNPPLGEKKINVQARKIPIYNDENASLTDAVANAHVKVSLNFPRQSANKENTLKPGRWNEGKFKKKSSVEQSFTSIPVTPRNSNFHVHVDENSDVPNTPKTDIMASNVLKARKCMYDDEKDIPVAIFEPHNPSKVPHYPKNKVYGGGTEYSLEELRAILYFQKEKEKWNRNENQDDRLGTKYDVHKDEFQITERKEVFIFNDDQLQVREEPQSQIRVDSQADCDYLVKGYQEVIPQKNDFKIFIEPEEDERTMKLKKEPAQVIPQRERRCVAETFHQMGEIPFSGCLKLPKLLKDKNESLIQSKETIQNGASCEQSLCDQSLTVNTKAILNDVKDMWVSSPPEKSKNYREPFVPRTPGYNSVVAKPEESFPAQPAVQFKIFSDASFIESENVNRINVHMKESEEDSYIIRKLANSGVSNKDESEDKRSQSQSVLKNTLQNNSVASRGFGFDQRPILYPPSAQTPSGIQGLNFTQKTEKVVAGDRNTTCTSESERFVEPAQRTIGPSKENFSVFTDFPVTAKDGNIVANFGIPFVPSPGMTPTQLAAMENTEDKENFIMGKNSKSSHCKSRKNILQPSNDVYFVPLEQQLAEEKSAQENVISDDTCCTEAFAVPLISSTPLVHSNFHIEQGVKQDDDDDNTIAFMNQCTKKQYINANSCDMTAMNPFTICNQQEKNNSGGVQCSVPGSHLSTIMELSEQKKSLSLTTTDRSSASKSSASNTGCKRGVSSTYPSLKSIVEDLGIKKELAFFCNDVTRIWEPFVFFSDKFREHCFDASGFPTEVHLNRCIKINKIWDVSLRRGCSFHSGNKEYVVNDVQLEKNPPLYSISERFSKKVRMLELKDNSQLWDQYIREEIVLRIQNSSLVKCFLVSEEVHIYSNKYLLISDVFTVELQDHLMEMQQMNGKKYMSEAQILCIAIEIMKIISYLHQCKIVHGNLSIRSFNTRNEHLFLNLKDIEYAVDLTLMPENTIFDASEKLVYSRMKATRLFPFQVDYIAIADILHHLIFNGPLRVHEERGVWCLSTSFPEHIDENMWRIVFSGLLNSNEIDLNHLIGLLVKG